VIVVNPSFPAKTLKEFIAAARAKPGTLNFAMPASATQTHLAAENFLHAANLNVISIPYKGEARR